MNLVFGTMNRSSHRPTCCSLFFILLSPINHPLIMVSKVHPASLGPEIPAAGSSAHPAAVNSSESDEITTTTIKATAHLTLPLNPVPLTYEQLNPRSKATEFFGPWGMLVVLLSTPLLTYSLFFLCNETTGCHPRDAASWRLLGDLIGEWPATNGQFFENSIKPAVIYFTFFAYLVACWVLIPVTRTEGTLIRDGTRKAYKLNGE